MTEIYMRLILFDHVRKPGKRYYLIVTFPGYIAAEIKNWNRAIFSEMNPEMVVFFYIFVVKMVHINNITGYNLLPQKTIIELTSENF